MKRRNTTRWTGTYDAIKQYFKVNNYTNNPILAVLRPYLLLPSEVTQLENLFKELEEFYYITKELQSDECTFTDARHYFDDLIEAFGVKYKEIKTHLSAKGKHVRHYLFEDSIRRIQENVSLTEAQHRVMTKFHVPVVVLAEVETPANRGESIVARYKKQKLSAPIVEYKSVNHVVATSNVVERLFSKAKLVFSDRRKSLTPKRLEQILYLLANSRFWDVKSVARCCNSSSEVEDVIPEDNSDEDDDQDDSMYLSGHMNEDDTPEVTVDTASTLSDSNDIV